MNCLICIKDNWHTPLVEVYQAVTAFDCLDKLQYNYPTIQCHSLWIISWQLYKQLYFKGNILWFSQKRYSKQWDISCWNILFLFSIVVEPYNMLWSTIISNGMHNLPPCRSTGWKVILLIHFKYNLFLLFSWTVWAREGFLKHLYHCNSMTELLAMMKKIF